MRDTLVKIYGMDEPQQKELLPQLTLSELSVLKVLVEEILAMKQELHRARQSVWIECGEGSDAGKRFAKKLARRLFPDKTQKKIDELVAKRDELEALYREKGYPDLEKLVWMRKKGIVEDEKYDCDKEAYIYFIHTLELGRLSRGIDMAIAQREIIEGQ